MLNISFEQETETNQWFVHLESDKVFGNAEVIKAGVPPGVYITVPPSLQPAITWYLTKKCDFVFLGSLPVDGEISDVLIKAR